MPTERLPRATNHSLVYGIAVLLLFLASTSGCGDSPDTAATPSAPSREVRSPDVSDDILHGPFADVNSHSSPLPEVTIEDPGGFSAAEESVIQKYAQAMKMMHEKQEALLRATERKLAAARAGNRSAAAAEAEKIDETWLALNAAADRVTLHGAKLNALVSGDTRRNERITARIKEITGIYPSDTSIIERQAKQAQENLKEAQRLLR